MICPFISGPVMYHDDTYQVVEYQCEKELCMAWHKEYKYCKLIDPR